MTIKALADKLGVNKEKIKYLYRQLPEHMYIMIENRVILSDAAVDAIINRLNGGELTSSIPVPPYDSVNPIGWGGSTDGETTGETADTNGESCDSAGESGDNSKNPPFTGEFTGQDWKKTGDGDSGEISLTFFDLYKTELQQKDRQLIAKDEQIKALTEHISVQSAQLADLTAALTERSTSTEQLTAMKEQICRMQETIDALTKQAEQPRKWWMWWKR